MARVRVKLNNKGFRALRSAPGVIADLERRGRAVAAAAGTDYQMSSQTGKTRHRVGITTGSMDAKEETARKATLLRALDAGRG